MHTIGDRRRSPVECRERLGGQILLGAAHDLGRGLVGHRRHQQTIGLERPGELQGRIGGFAAQNQRLAAAPARRAGLRPLLAHPIGAGFDLQALHLMCPVECGRHTAIDGGLDGQRVGSRLLGAQIDAQEVARRVTLRSLGKMELGHLLLCRLRERRSRCAKK